MEDLGSRIALEGEHDLIWYPAEVNTSIRPGWFYHPEEDGQVKSLEELVHIYLGSVGGNATFLLNIPPMPNGLLHENDVERLRELGEWQQRSFSRNLLEESHRPVELVFALDEAEDVGYLVLKEEIRNSQRVEAFEVFVRDQGEWEKVYTGTVIGYKKIIPLFKENVKEIRIVLNDYRVLPQISFVGVYPRKK